MDQKFILWCTKWSTKGCIRKDKKRIRKSYTIFNWILTVIIVMNRKHREWLVFPSRIDCDTSVAVALCCTYLIYCLRSFFLRVQKCHLLTSLSVPSPRVVQMSAGWTDNDGVCIERKVTLPFPSLHDSLTRFPLSPVAHVSGRQLLRILLPCPGSVLCSVALWLINKPTDNCQRAGFPPEVSMTFSFKFFNGDLTRIHQSPSLLRWMDGQRQTYSSNWNFFNIFPPFHCQPCYRTSIL